MNKTFIQARVTHYEGLITAYEDAILNLKNPAIEEYSINTGQTQQRVKRGDLANLQKLLNGFYAQYEIWCNRLNGSGTTIMRPAW